MKMFKSLLVIIPGGETGMVEELHHVNHPPKKILLHQAAIAARAAAVTKKKTVERGVPEGKILVELNE